MKRSCAEESVPEGLVAGLVLMKEARDTASGPAVLADGDIDAEAAALGIVARVLSVARLPRDRAGVSGLPRPGFVRAKAHRP
jgi:hypothetical protein